MALRAALLAAGRGVRMGGARPKTLIPVGDHEPLLFYILKGLAASGIDDLLVVTGFSPGQVQGYVEDNWSGKVSFVRNARYASWGNFHSVRVAIDGSPGADLLVVNSDVVVHPGIFRRVAEEPGDLVLAVEPKDRLDPEEMRVSLDGATVTAIGKGLDMSQSHGEFVGVSLLRPAAAEVYARLATDLEWSGRTSLYYEDVYGHMLGGLEVRAARVGSGEYAEVDEPADVERAVAVITGHGRAWEGGPAASESA
ncbi:NTP transferase domain-containing protein [soil metagenome]